ncbi:MAG: hypothetical protein PHU08_03385 [Dehalococcoidales bacterium]|nr:hypothetical protein [Dehalococcoidales bacterium]
MLNKYFNRIYRGERGITGLETAIILIAFVVVAAVFAYTVLSAGLFTTQKSSEAVYSGIQEARSTVSLKGDVIAKAEETGASGNVSQITFAITNVLGGEPIDFTPPTDDSATGLAKASSSNAVVITYIDKDQEVQDLYWTASQIGYGNSNNILDAGETFQITIGSDTHGSGAGNLIDALSTHQLDAYRTFTLQIKTSKGAVLSFERTAPAYIDSVMNLH